MMLDHVRAKRAVTMFAMAWLGLTAAVAAATLPLGLERSDTHTGWFLEERTASAQGACGNNLLANPSFEGGFRKTEAEGTSLSSAVSDGWSPWFVRGNETWNREPEFKVVIPGVNGDAYRVRSGQSMKWFTTWGTHTAGIYQTVSVPAGSALTFSAWGMIYSGEDDGHRPDLNTYFSDPEKPGNYRIAVGIDPTGARPPIGSHPPDSVVWSEPSMTTDQFVKLSVAARAAAGAVTVYTKGWAEYPVKHNDSFWDEACLVFGGAVAAPPVAVDAAPPGNDEAEGASQDQAQAPAPRDSYIPRPASPTEIKSKGRRSYIPR